MNQDFITSLPYDSQLEIFDYLRDRLPLLKSLNSTIKENIASHYKQNKTEKNIAYESQNLNLYVKKSTFITQSAKVAALHKNLPLTKDLNNLFPVTDDILFAIVKNNRLDLLNELIKDWPFPTNDLMPRWGFIGLLIIFECENNDIFEWFIKNIDCFFCPLYSQKFDFNFKLVTFLKFLPKYRNLDKMSFEIKPHLIHRFLQRFPVFRDHYRTHFLKSLKRGKLSSTFKIIRSVDLNIFNSFDREVYLTDEPFILDCFQKQTPQSLAELKSYCEIFFIPFDSLNNIRVCLNKLCNKYAVFYDWYEPFIKMPQLVFNDSNISKGPQKFTKNCLDFYKHHHQQGAIDAFFRENLIECDSKETYQFVFSNFVNLDNNEEIKWLLESKRVKLFEYAFKHGHLKTVFDVLQQEDSALTILEHLDMSDKMFRKLQIIIYLRYYQPKFGFFFTDDNFDKKFLLWHKLIFSFFTNEHELEDELILKEICDIFIQLGAPKVQLKSKPQFAPIWYKSEFISFLSLYADIKNVTNFELWLPDFNKIGKEVIEFFVLHKIKPSTFYWINNINRIDSFNTLLLMKSHNMINYHLFYQITIKLMKWDILEYGLNLLFPDWKKFLMFHSELKKTLCLLSKEFTNHYTKILMNESDFIK